MALQKCPECGHEISTDARKCPHCGKQRGLSTLIKAALAIVGIILLISYLPSFCSIADIPSYESYQERGRKASEHAEKTIILTGKGKKLKVKYPEWSNSVCNAVANKNIYLGMTNEQVRLAWGKPYRINSSTGSYGKHEQWVMRDSINSDYLYFEDGILKSMQRSE